MSEFPRFVSAGEALTDFIRTGPDAWISRPGGADWNVARVVATLGVPSAFAGAVSTDRFGDELARLGREAGLDPRFLQRIGKAPLIAMVHETSPPAYFFVGSDSADLAFQPALLPHGWLDHAEWLHFGCISLAREPLAGKLLRLLDAAKAAGRKISFDPNYRNIMTEAFDATLRYVAQRADVIKVSDEDLRGLFRTDDAAEGFAGLRELNPGAPILLTRGAEGAELHAGSKVLRQAPPAINVVDTVGAGDASVGGLLYSLMTRPDAGWGEHLKFAVATGTAACLHAGAVPPTLSSVTGLLRKM
ncbi:MAG TPA: carbohydrate kinase [Burkholderiales bacterium]